MTPSQGRQVRDDVVQEFAIHSTTDEFARLSWWAAHASGCPVREMVKEETEHRPVWGLMRAARDVKIPWYSSNSIISHVLQAVVLVRGTVVGLMDQPEMLLVLILRLPHDLDIKEVFARATREYQEYFELRGVLQVFYTRKNYEQVSWRSFGVLPTRSLQSVSLKGDMQVQLLADANRFLQEEDVYDRAGRPYKRVYCLYGPPGTGKTSTVMAIASELGKDMAIFNVDSLRDDTFIDLLSGLPKGAVIMFEDVDAMFKQRESNAGGMSFSTLLNVLDGILHPRGALIFLTTNHIDRLDSALHRPGRVDRLIEVGNSSSEQRVSLWSSVFPSVPAPDILLKENPNISPAWLTTLLFQHRNETLEEVIAVLTLGLRTLKPPAERKKDKEKVKKVKKAKAAPG